jgi:hypothetical protein
MTKHPPQHKREQEKEEPCGKQSSAKIEETGAPPHTIASSETPDKKKIWGEDIDDYPLRESNEDPRWAVRTVWIWVWFALFCLIFILTLLIFGLFYD